MPVVVASLDAGGVEGELPRCFPLHPLPRRAARPIPGANQPTRGAKSVLWFFPHLLPPACPAPSDGRDRDPLLRDPPGQPRPRFAPLRPSPPQRARTSLPTLTHRPPHSSLPPQNTPAELLNYNSGLELEILGSLVRSDVHVRILSLLADPSRVFSTPAGADGSPSEGAFKMRSYALFCKEYLGGADNNLFTLNAEASPLYPTLISSTACPFTSSNFPDKNSKQEPRNPPPAADRAAGARGVPPRRRRGPPRGVQGGHGEVPLRPPAGPRVPRRLHAHGAHAPRMLLFALRPRACGLRPSGRWPSARRGKREGDSSPDAAAAGSCCAQVWRTRGESDEVAEHVHEALKARGRRCCASALSLTLLCGGSPARRGEGGSLNPSGPPPADAPPAADVARQRDGEGPGARRLAP